jgi:phosphonate transport system substrate-binding protein
VFSATQSWKRVLLTASAAVALSPAVLLPTPLAAQTLRFGAVSFYNPRLMYLKYQPLMDYLTRVTGRPWVLDLSYSYTNTLEKLESGEVDAAYLGPLPYVVAHETFGAEPIVRLNTDGSATYTSLIMVRSDSGISDLSQLAGKRFAFGAPLSTSSHLVPWMMLKRAGLDPCFCTEEAGAGASGSRSASSSRRVESRFYEQNERAARAVLLGEADACGIRDIVGRKFLDRGLTVIATSDSIPNYPFVLSPKAAPGVRAMLVEALIERPQTDPEVRSTIEGWDEELSAGFAVCSDADYDVIRDWARSVFGPNCLAHPEIMLKRPECP